MTKLFEGKEGEKGKGEVTVSVFSRTLNHLMVAEFSVLRRTDTLK